jgi:succinate-semialdehyde dehydrogenase / glutarate-semialdehyde dehydrogenase
MLKLDNNSLIRGQAYVDGEWRAGRSGAGFAVRNPATHEVITEVADLDEQDTREAIEAADRAFPAWRAKTAKERAAILRKWYELMMASQEDLAQLMTAEQGKPLAESRGEIAYGASFIEWFAEEGKRIYGDVIPTNAHGRRIIVVKEPIGVVGAVTPWNFPNAMITRKVGPALAAGCTVVVKPAQLTPLSALALAELAHRAGLPKGVFNVVPSTKSSRVGKELTTNPLVKKFSFTGSTEVGKQLMAQCASTVKKVSLELGGNAPFIVFDDADLDAAVKGAMLSKFRNMGQTCVCANRFLVQDGVYDAFAEKLKKAVAALKVGDGATPGTEQGPLINMAAIEKVESLLADGVKHGAKIDLGGKRHKLGGTFFEPTIVRDAMPEMAFAREEIFGPVVTLFRFSKDEDAIRMANDTEYGLAAYFYARDVGRIFKVMEGLQYGIVGVNEGIISTEVAPFGGMKESGIGREGSKYGIDDFVQIKYVAMGGLGIP